MYLLKVINAEKAAARAPAFIKRLNRSRELLFKCLFNTHYQPCTM